MTFQELLTCIFSIMWISVVFWVIIGLIPILINKAIDLFESVTK